MIVEKRNEEGKKIEIDTTPETNIGVEMYLMNRKKPEPRPKNFVERLNAHSNLKETYLKSHTLVWDTRDGKDIKIQIGAKSFRTKHIEFQGVGRRSLYIFTKDEEKEDQHKILVFSEREAESLKL